MKIENIADKLVKHPTRKYGKRPIASIKRTILHTSDHATATAYDIAQWDITPTYTKNGRVYKNNLSDKGAPGMTYHAFIDKSGKIYHTSNFDNLTWHAAGHNTDSLGICIQYKATGNTKPPPLKQIKTAIEYLSYVNLYLGIPPNQTFGHRELKGTGWFFSKGKKRLRKTCPGMLVNLDSMRDDITISMQKRLKKEYLYKGRIDGDFGPKSLAALQAFSKRVFSKLSGKY